MVDFAAVAESAAVSPGAVVGSVEEPHCQVGSVKVAVQADHAERGDGVGVEFGQGVRPDAGSQPGDEGSQDDGDRVAVVSADRDQASEHVIRICGVGWPVAVDDGDDLVELFPLGQEAAAAVLVLVGCGCQGGEPEGWVADDGFVGGVDCPVLVHSGVRSFGGSNASSEIGVPAFVPIYVPIPVPIDTFVAHNCPLLSFEVR